MRLLLRTNSHKIREMLKEAGFDIPQEVEESTGILWEDGVFTGVDKKDKTIKCDRSLGFDVVLLIKLIKMGDPEKIKEFIISERDKEAQIQKIRNHVVKCKCCGNYMRYGEYSPQLKDDVWHTVVSNLNLTEYEQQAKRRFKKYKHPWYPQEHLFLCDLCMERGLKRPLEPTDLEECEHNHIYFKRWRIKPKKWRKKKYRYIRYLKRFEREVASGKRAAMPKNLYE